MTALNMSGHIDGNFATVPVRVVLTSGGYVDGIWTPLPGKEYTFPRVTIQPLNDKELDFLMRANERIVDTRKMYINSGDFDVLQLGAICTFLNQDWKVIKADVRPWRKYAKIIVDRIDGQ